MMKRMTKLKKIIAVLQIVLLLVPLSGCWNYREIETLSVVSGIAIDKGQNGYKYHMTFECLNMSGGQGESGAKPIVIETDGDTIFDAVRKALSESDKKLYFSDCKIVVLSSQLAEEGILPILDWFMRDAEMRVTIDFLISKEKTAGEILRQTSQSKESLSFQIFGMLKEAAKLDAQGPQVPLYKINNILNTAGVDLILPSIQVKKSEGGSTLELGENAIFRGDKLVGWLKKEQCKYFMFIDNEISGGLLLTGLNSGENNITLEILSSKTTVVPTVSNGTVTMKIDIHTTVAYAEANSEKNYLEKNSVETIEKCADKTLKSGVENVISTMQKQYGSDIFGFGDMIDKDLPDDWDKLEKNWDKTFSSIKYNVNADVKIENTGLSLAEGGD